MSATEINKYKEYLVEDLSIAHGVTKVQADSIVQKSAINRLLCNYPEHVMHYPIQSWVEDIWKEHNGMPVR